MIPSITKPLVSIIIPTYNRAHFLRECVESVFNQTYRPIEIVIIDDGSNDKTIELLTELEAEASQLEDIKLIWKSVDNGGAPRARNLGFNISAGEYIVFLDSDDMLLPEKVATQAKQLEGGLFDMVYARNQRLGLHGEMIKKLSGRALTNDSRDLFEYSWQTMCALYRRSYLEEVGPWNEKLVISQDWEYCIRCILCGGGIGYLNKALQLYRYHDSGRIGDQQTLKATQSKEAATLSIYNRIVETGKMDKWLKSVYTKRFQYCACQYGLNHDLENLQRVLNFLEKEELIDSRRKRILGWGLKRPYVAIFWFIYSRLQNLHKALSRRFNR